MFTTRNTSDTIETSRKVAATIGAFCALSAFPVFILGIVFSNGSYLVTSATAAAASLIGFLWCSFAREDCYTEGSRLLALVAFVLASGLALYLNIIFLLWGAGYELPIAAVRNSAMVDHRYVGPIVLVFTLFAWAVVKVGRR